MSRNEVCAVCRASRQRSREHMEQMEAVQCKDELAAYDRFAAAAMPAYSNIGREDDAAGDCDRYARAMLAKRREFARELREGVK